MSKGFLGRIQFHLSPCAAHTIGCSRELSNRNPIVANWRKLWRCRSPNHSHVCIHRPCVKAPSTELIRHRCCHNRSIRKRHRENSATSPSLRSATTSNCCNWLRGAVLFHSLPDIFSLLIVTHITYFFELIFTFHISHFYGIFHLLFRV